MLAWVFGVAIVVGFLDACGIGANDVCNSFASTVASGALTFRQAIIVASIFEFAGAVGMGASVTGTISSGIAKTSSFVNQPEILMYGMLCALIASATWNATATRFGLPVSTTHSIIGGVIGMSIIGAGFSSVVWSQSKDTFPFFKGVTAIVTSWFTSPIFASMLSALLFSTVRYIVTRQNGFKYALIAFPATTGVTSWVLSFFIMQKSPKIHLSDGTAAWIASIVSAVCAIIGAAFIPFVKRSCLALETKDAESQITKPIEEQIGEQNDDNDGVVKEIADVTLLKDNFVVEKFDPKCEGVFRYLQVVTACTMSFAHGSNDVANAMGPLSAIYSIFSTGEVLATVDVPIWILAIGGTGIVTGCLFFGRKMIRVLGTKMTKVTNTRGYCIELSTAIVISVGSRFGMPLSTTHCVVGSLVGVGIVDAITTRTSTSFRWKRLILFFSGWVVTLIFTAGLAALVTAQGIYAPSKECVV